MTTGKPYSRCATLCFFFFFSQMNVGSAGLPLTGHRFRFQNMVWIAPIDCCSGCHHCFSLIWWTAAVLFHKLFINFWTSLTQKRTGTRGRNRDWSHEARVGERGEGGEGGEGLRGDIRSGVQHGGSSALTSTTLLFADGRNNRRREKNPSQDSEPLTSRRGPPP